MRKKLIEACHRGISSGKEMLRGKYKLGDNVQSLTEGIRSRWLIIRGRRGLRTLEQIALPLMN
ncbi:hypothetical protein [Paraburkholderia sp. MM5482-R1]|uniref:hypothetical protein n=1 Tax=unclassified Paraburkholderia TaxID=2615204 RepID=UPI003D1A1DEE